MQCTSNILLQQCMLSARAASQSCQCTPPGKLCTKACTAAIVCLRYTAQRRHSVPNHILINLYTLHASYKDGKKVIAFKPAGMAFKTCEGAILKPHLAPGLDDPAIGLGPHTCRLEGKCYLSCCPHQGHMPSSALMLGCRLSGHFVKAQAIEVSGIWCELGVSTLCGNVSQAAKTNSRLNIRVFLH